MKRESDPAEVVWFKRDLRVSDHRPLVEAAERGPVICLYVFEPELWQSPESDGSHLVFVGESLATLCERLRTLGGALVIRVGAVPEVLGTLWKTHRFARLWSREETGNALTYERDKQVADWARERGVQWTEIPQNGVVRPLGSRDGWSNRCEGEFRQDRFEAWCRGETGYPMVDACMRALHATGWINFRMRAMLVSFASYHLWLHWRQTAVFLARHFLDFEPGIHFSQFQMQSGVTGINALRIYSPAKQVIDQDPEGEFLRRYCPELEAVPKVYLPEPHRMPVSLQKQIGCVIGKNYPKPVVGHREAYALARKRMGEIRNRPETRAASQQVQEKHGSRKRPAGRTTRR